MAEDALAQIADAAHAVETNAEQLATALAGQGAEEAAKFFTQCAKAAHEVVQQVPAAPGKQPAETEEPEEAPPGEAEPNPAGARTPYEGASQGLQAEVARKRKG